MSSNIVEIALEIDFIGMVISERTEVMDDHWGNVLAKIKFTTPLDASLFREAKYVYCLFYMDLVRDENIIRNPRHPRNDPKLPLMGIFAQRAKNRPNKIGLSCAKIITIHEHDSLIQEIIVQGLDAIDGTPMLAIKPWMPDFEPELESVKEASWMKEVMKNYFLGSLPEDISARLLELKVSKRTVTKRIAFTPLASVSQTNPSSGKLTIAISDPTLNDSVFTGLDMFSYVYVIYVKPGSSSIDFVIAKIECEEDTPNNHSETLVVSVPTLPKGAIILDIKPYSVLFFPTL